MMSMSTLAQPPADRRAGKGPRMTARRARTSSGPIAVATASQRRRRDTGPLTDKGQARQAQLLAAARLVFERQGFLDTRVADIVAEANVAQGSFYTYFDSKDTIFRAVAQGVIDTMLTALHSCASRSGGTRAGWSEPGHRPGHRGYLRMFTARATTSTATTSEIASSAIIMSLDQGRIAETSVGLNAAAVVNDRCR